MKSSSRTSLIPIIAIVFFMVNTIVFFVVLTADVVADQTSPSEGNRSGVGASGYEGTPDQ